MCFPHISPGAARCARCAIFVPQLTYDQSDVSSFDSIRLVASRGHSHFVLKCYSPVWSALRTAHQPVHGGMPLLGVLDFCNLLIYALPEPHAVVLCITLGGIRNRCGMMTHCGMARKAGVHHDMWSAGA